MGIKGDRLKKASEEAATALTNSLAPLSDITSKKMFGGHGIFHNGKMFGIVDAQGTCFFKVDDSTKQEFMDAGAEPHGKMPYYSIPEEVLSNEKKLIDWAQKAISLSA